MLRSVPAMFRKPSPPPPESPARRFTDAVETPVTVIGPGTRIRGSLTGEDPVDLAGTLEGPFSVTGFCWVREGARIVGDVTATSVVVEGEVSGKTLVADKVEIGAAARVRANIRARVVAVAEGAFFEGEVHMEGRADPAIPMAFKEKRKDRRGEDQEPSSGKEP